MDVLIKFHDQTAPESGLCRCLTAVGASSNLSRLCTCGCYKIDQARRRACCVRAQWRFCWADPGREQREGREGCTEGGSEGGWMVAGDGSGGRGN
jgi:hypothetical protein